MKIIIPDNVLHKVKEDSILVGFRGSVAHSTYSENSIDDVDLMSITIPSIENYFGLEHYGNKGTKDFFIDKYDIVIYELKKFISLLEKGNPNVISMLWLDDYILKTKFGEMLINNREIFFSQEIHKSFSGYAKQQLYKMTHFNEQARKEMRIFELELRKRKLGIEIDKNYNPINNKEYFLNQIAIGYTLKGESEKISDQDIIFWFNWYRYKYANGYMGEKRRKLVEQFSWDCKNGSHLIRLLRMGIEFLKDKKFYVKRKDRQELLDIKNGKYSLEEVKKMSDDLFAEAEELFKKTDLPKLPDKKKINNLCVSILEEYFYPEGVA